MRKFFTPKYRLGILSLLLICLSLNANASTQIWPFGHKKAKSVSTDPIESEYDQFVNASKIKCEGFINVYLCEDRVYFEIPNEVFGRDLLLGSTIKSTSDNKSGIVGSKDDLIHFTFTKTDSHIQMRKVDSSYIGSEENIENALSKSNIGAIMENFEIELCNDDSTSFIIDMTDIFLGDDYDELVPFLDNSVYLDKEYELAFEFEDDKSFIEGIKAFDDNVSVTSMMSFNYEVRGESGTTVVAESAFSAEMVRSILLLPQKVYHPRAADPRIGYFHTDIKQMGDLSKNTKEINLVQRWDLTPSDTAAFLRGELVEPVKPIVFYIDSDFPNWWKPYIRKAVEMWNAPFERIGFKNAIIAKDFPSDDEKFDPDNIKYSCIRYAPLDDENAMGPSWVDPRSGEIINASVYIYHDIIKLLQQWLFVQTSQADERVRTANIPQEILGEALCYAVRHEIGHTLGLSHNMGASATIPVDSLKSASFTKVNGTTNSIMDYARFNYVASQNDKGVKLTPPDFGAYDYWAIRWGYQPILSDLGFEKEKEITSGWITDLLKVSPIYRYGKQQRTSKFFDPRNQSEDLGDDAIKASQAGTDNLKFILSNLDQWIKDEDDPDMTLHAYLLEGIASQYMKYVRHVAMNVGGLYKNEVGPKDEAKRFENIPRQKQIDALNMLIRMSEDTEWLDNKALLQKIGETGSPSSSVRTLIYDELLYTPFYAGKSDGIDTNEFSSTECMDIIFDYAFKGTKAGKKLTASERELQRTFIDTMMERGDFKTLSSSSKHLSYKVDSIGFETSGFGYTADSTFNESSITQATLYSYIIKARDLINAKKASANDIDKAHYEILLGRISYSIK